MHGRIITRFLQSVPIPRQTALPVKQPKSCLLKMWHKQNADTLDVPEALLTLPDMSEAGKVRDLRQVIPFSHWDEQERMIALINLDLVLTHHIAEVVQMHPG